MVKVVDLREDFRRLGRSHDFLSWRALSTAGRPQPPRSLCRLFSPGIDR